MTSAPVFRRAVEADLPALVALFAADELGGHGDTTDPAAAGGYLAAFREIVATPGTPLYVAELDGAVVGTFQLVLARSLFARGAVHATLHAVQVSAHLRGRGIGADMVRFAMDEARAAGAGSLVLTSSKRRLDAHRFYRRLGFANSHEGFKIGL